MRLSRHELGLKGERLAADYLHGLGWEIVAERLREGGGEVDLLCRDDGWMVFVEVRARTGHTFGSATESVDAWKVFRMSRVVPATLARYNWRGPFRLDVVALLLSPDGDLRTLTHLKDID